MDKLLLQLVGPQTPAVHGNDGRSGLSKPLSLYSAYSWRGRIGLIVLSTNTTLECEVARIALDDVGVCVSRVHQTGPQEPSSYSPMADGIATVSTLLAASEINVFAFGCTCCTYFVPTNTVKAVMQENTGCLTILAAGAVTDALRALKLKRIAVVGPRTEFVT